MSSSKYEEQQKEIKEIFDKHPKGSVTNLPDCGGYCSELVKN